MRMQLKLMTTMALRPATLRSKSLSRTVTHRLFSSPPFEAPTPPSFKGQPVFPDIDFHHAQSPSSQSLIRNTDSNAVFVINGASRGIGLQYVKSLVQRTRGNIMACCRSPDTAHALNEYLSSMNSNERDRVMVVPLDVEDQNQIESVGKIAKQSYGRVDALFNVAGLLGDGTSTPGPERSMAKLDRAWIEKTMAVNTIGPVMLAKELVPMMKSVKPRGKKALEDYKGDRAKSIIVNMSARVGSVSDNELGGWYSYRFSKTALNQATRTMAHELKRQGTWTVALHPGTTDTDLSTPFQKNVKDGRLFPVEFTVGRMLDVVDSMEEDNSGGFYDWAGTALPF